MESCPLICTFLSYKFWLFVTILLTYKLYFLLTKGVCKSAKCLIGKTVLITGANAGIGFETALDIASRGAKVIIACRDKQRGQQACDDIIARSGNPNVSLQILDLASFDSVRQCAKNIHATEEKIDILINNAGVSHFKRITGDGLNMTTQVNYCSVFLFTILLKDLLLKGDKARIVNLSSCLADFGIYYEGHLRETENLSIWTSHSPYVISKFYIILFTKELAKRLKGTDVTTYSVHPGVIRTKIFKGANLFLRTFLFVINSLNTKDTFEGAQPTLHCALEEGLEKYSGQYFVDCKYVPKNYSDELTKKVWDETVDLLKLTPEQLDFNIS